MKAMPSAEFRMTNAAVQQVAGSPARAEFGTRHSAFGIALRAVVLGVSLIAIILLAGCKKKKPPIPPPQAQAPTITQPLPEQIPPATEPPPEVQQPPTPPPPEEKPKPKPRRSSRGRKPAEKPAEKPAPPPPPPSQQPPRTVVQEGGTTQPQPQGELTASITHDSAQHQRMNTAQLLDSTEFNLKSISRALNADEQAMVSHIRSFEQQSRAATAEGDLERAYNLALKAHLLSDELIKR